MWEFSEMITIKGQIFKSVYSRIGRPNLAQPVPGTNNYMTYLAGSPPAMLWGRTDEEKKAYED